MSFGGGRKECSVTDETKHLNVAIYAVDLDALKQYMEMVGWTR